MYISIHDRIKKTLALLAIFAMIGTSVPVGALTAFAQEVTEETSSEVITETEEASSEEESTEEGSTEESEETDTDATTATIPAAEETLETAATSEEPEAVTGFVVDADGIATVSTVALGVTYTAPQNDQVQVTFTQLPETVGSPSIQEVLLTDEQVAQLGALSNVAYDITSTMENGTFAYDLTLPLPEGAEENAQVVFAETAEDLSSGDVESVASAQVDVVTNEQTVAITELDHFTIFVVTSFEEPQVTPPATSYNGVWTALGIGAAVTQALSGTDGITSAEGANHAVIKTSAYTDWDGRKSEFPEGGYDTRVDVYVDMSLATGQLLTKRMAFSSAINDISGDHQRDFVFHLGTKTLSSGKWVVSASESLVDLPGNPFHSPVTLTQTGWYTLEHQFRDVGGMLEVTLNIYKKGETAPVGSWTLSNGSDEIGSTVGGNRYGWFIDTGILNRFNKIAIDNAEIEYATDAAPSVSPLLSGETIYDAIPEILPSNLPSQPYQAQATSEFGDEITFEPGTGRSLLDGAITLSSWACESGEWNLGTCETTPGATFEHPITLNLYNVAEDGSVGTLIASRTETFEIPYRPSANVTCADPKQWKDTNGNCFNGYNYVVVFDLAGIVVPDSVIFGVAYNTNTYGDAPMGATGPYDSLNVSLNTDTSAPYIGTDVDTDEMFWDATYLGRPAGLSSDMGWSAYRIAATFTAEPLPETPAGLEYDGDPVLSCGSFTNINYAYPVWDAVDGAVSYDYQALFNNVVVYSTNFATNAHPGGTFGGGQNGVWGFQVRSVDGVGQKSDWSSVCEITLDTEAPAAPVHLSPANNSTQDFNDFYFDWTDVADVVEYEFQAAQDSTVDGNGALVNGVWNNIAHGAPDRDFLSDSTIHSYGANGTWYWQVRAIDAASNKSPWTMPWKMTIDLDGPDPVPVSEILSPEVDEVVSGTIELAAFYADENGDDNDAVQWAVRSGTCAANTGTVFGNVDAHNDSFTWNSENFSSMFDTTQVSNGSYCFVFNPTEDAGGENQRLTRTFTVENEIVDTTAPAVPTGLAWTDSENNDVPDNGTTALYAGAASWNENEESDFDHYIYKYWNDIESSVYRDETTSWTQNMPGVSNTNAGGVFNQGEGVHHFCIMAVDAAGNESACSAPFTITYMVPIVVIPDEELTPITMCKFVNEVPQAGWGMTLSNEEYEGPTVYSTTTDETGCVTISVDLEDGPWNVVEEDRGGYTQDAVEASQGYVSSVGESDTDMCVFGLPAKYTFVSVQDDEDTEYDYSCSFFNSQDVVDNEDNSDTPSFSSATRLGSRSSARGTGQVLGAATSAEEESDFCVEPYLTDNLGFGHENNPAQVIRLQNFLNDYMSAGLAVTGVFETSTEQAVMDFQLRYAADILTPWGISNATGFVYHTTKKKINEMVCERDFPLTQEQLDEINRVKNQIAGGITTLGTPQETVAGAETTTNEGTTDASDDTSSSSTDDENKVDEEEEQGFFGRLWDSIFGG